ncbi:MAG: L-serine ammonia-lyase [Pseudomonadota bacterium]
MPISVFDIFKIGVGPSSSHTMGPMSAAARFRREAVEALTARGDTADPFRFECRLFGSLAWTGRGHATDGAVTLGLCGVEPDRFDADEAEGLKALVATEGRTPEAGPVSLLYDAEQDLIFDFETTREEHPNAMALRCLRAGEGPMRGEVMLERTYFSIGGGFVLEAAEMAAREDAGLAQPAETPPPHPFRTAAELLSLCQTRGLSIDAVARANERARRGISDEEVDARLDALLDAMFACIDRGLKTRGPLPGHLKVKRRAPDLADSLSDGRNALQPHAATDWLMVYAMAVNEENAAGGKVVTAPTNGAAGVTPAVLRYYLGHCIGADRAGARRFLLTAGVIGALIKSNASISGAEVGCQGEVGSAAAMAAAGLAAGLGATPEQVENAAEIALEHHLGMTCDPVGGLVQIPCIERNGLGAIKAVSAASLALRGDGAHLVPLDACIETMRQTGLDMNARYKETSQGGLAVNLPEC